MLISYRPSVSGGSPLDRALLPKVYDAGFREISDIRCERVVHTLGAEPCRAEFSVVLDSYHEWRDGDGNMHDGVRRVEDAIPPGTLSVGIDDVVIVGVPLDRSRVLVIFRGRITDVGAWLSESGEGATLTALDPRHVLDFRPLGGARWADTAGGIIETDGPLVFNPDNLGNHDPEGSAAEGQPLFGDPTEPSTDDDAYARHWHLGQFWEYVVGNFAPASDSRLAAASCLPRLGDDDDAVLAPTDVDGMRPSDAIDRVLSTYGLDWWADPFAVVNRWSPFGETALPSFRILPPDAAPVKSVRLQEAGSTFSKDETNINAATLTFTTRTSVNQWRIEGDFKEYEARFELVKQWTDSEESQVSADPDVGNRAHLDYDPTLDHVRRQWGLNEDARWPDRETFDFDDFFDEGVWARRRRRFSCPYAGTDEEPRRCVVEVKNTDLDDDWHRVGSGTIRLLEDRAGVYFDMPDVDGTTSRLHIEDGPPQALEDITHVRITATLKSDERVAYEAQKQETSGSSQTITRTARNDTFRWVKRHESSAYASGTEVVRDDSASGGPMEQAAARFREKTSARGTGAALSIPWVDLAYRVGDRIEGLGGRDIGLRGRPGDDPEPPKAARVTYDFRSQRTHLSLVPATR